MHLKRVRDPPHTPHGCVPQAALSLGNECSQEGEGREEAETGLRIPTPTKLGPTLTPKEFEVTQPWGEGRRTFQLRPVSFG